MLIDSHCHLNFNHFAHDFKDVIEDSIESDVWMIVVGTNFKTSLQAAQIAAMYKKGVYATIGLHPIHLEKQKVSENGSAFTTAGEEFDLIKYMKLAFDSIVKSPISRSFIKTGKSCGRVVGIGETGFDYSYLKDNEDEENDKKIQKQRIVFNYHIELAQKLNLPLIIHARGKNLDSFKVYDDLIEFLKQKQFSSNNKIHGIIHGFYGTSEHAKRLTEMGYLLGINALIFKSDDLQNAVKNVDIKYLSLETDSPYFAPNDIDNKKRNEPKNVHVISQELATIKNMSIYEINNQTTANILQLFNILG